MLMVWNQGPVTSAGWGHITVKKKEKEKRYDRNDLRFKEETNVLLAAETN